MVDACDMTLARLKDAIGAINKTAIPITKAGTWVENILTLKDGKVCSYTGPLDKDSYIMPICKLNGPVFK